MRLPFFVVWPLDLGHGRPAAGQERARLEAAGCTFSLHILGCLSRFPHLRIVPCHLWALCGILPSSDSEV